MSEINEKDYISVKEAAKILIKEGVLKKSPYADQGVKRLISEGSIEAFKSPVPRIGYRVNVASLNQYVKIGKMNTAELRKAYLELLIKMESKEVVEDTAADDVPVGQTSIDEFVEGKTATMVEEKEVAKGKKKKA